MYARIQDQVNTNIEKTIATLTQTQHYMKSEWEKIKQEHDLIQEQQQSLREDRLRLDKERKMLRDEREAFDQEKKVVEDKNLKTITQVKLNVGGEEVITSKSTLLSIKGTMIDAMFSGRHKLREDANGSYFLDRNLTYFRWVLMYLRTHKLQLPVEKTERQRVLEEFDYFCVPIEDQTPPHTDFLTKSFVNSQTFHSDSWVLCLKVINNLIVSGYRDNSIKIWDTITGECQHIFHDDSDTNGIEGVDLIDNITLVSGSKCLKIWDIPSNECTHTINDDVLIGFKIFGKKIYSMWEDGGIKIYDVSSGVFERKWTSVLGCWVSCSDASESKVVTESVNDYQFLIWDVKTENCQVHMEGHKEPVCFVKIYGKRVYSGSYDKTLRIWDLKNGTCLKTLRGHHRSVCAIDVAGNVIVSGSVDKTVKIWNIDTDECVLTLEGHQNTVSCVEIVGNMIVTGSWDNTIKVWNVDDSPRGTWRFKM